MVYVFVGRTDPARPEPLPRDPLIRSAAAVRRTGNATDQEPERQPRRERDRRSPDPPNPRRRRLYELLFDEIDGIDSLDTRQKSRIKHNIRTHLTAGLPPPPAVVPQPDHDEQDIAEALIADTAAPVPVDEERIVHVAAPTHPHLPPEDVAENTLLALQLRECLARRTDTARRVAIYLHLLLTLNGALRPHVIMDA